jgi:hypothetical protein
VVRTVHADPARGERLVQWARWFSADRARSRFVRRPVALDESVRDGERETREDPAEDGPQC